MVAPAGIVTLDCTVVLGSLDDKLIPTPPTAAGLDSVTVPTDLAPPITDVGETEIEDKTGEEIARTALIETPPMDPVIVADELLCTAVVLTVNVADVEPAETVTELGTVTFDQLEANPTTEPPAGAGALIVTVPCEEDPPATVDGEREMPVSVRGVIVRVAGSVAVPKVAMIVAETVLDTVEVEIVNVAALAPAETVTWAGTVALELLDDRITEAPPGPAGPFSVTVPTELFPPLTEGGASTRLVRVAALTVRVDVTFETPNDAVIVTD